MAIHQPDISRAAPEVSKLSTEELKELCNATSNDRYDQFVNDSEQVMYAFGISTHTLSQLN